MGSHPGPQTPLPKLKSTILLRKGGLLLELDTSESAVWLKEASPRTSFLTNVGSGANINDRSYQVIAQFVPVQFDPTDPGQIQQFEAFNNLESQSILKAEWIKPIKDRKPLQRVATLRIFLRDAASANKILKAGAHIYNKRITPKKPKREPIRCLRCQRFGHERRDCNAILARCGKCAGNHETEACTIDYLATRCVNCDGRHPSFDRDCTKFLEKCHLLDNRCPENKLAFYPTADEWTWVTVDQAAQADPLHPHPAPHRPTHRSGRTQTRLTGSNNTPLGQPAPNSSQPPPPPRTNPMNEFPTEHLRIWQQNLNKSLTSQLHLLNTARPAVWDILILQEPWMGHLGTRSSPHWRVLYPNSYYINKSKTPRSIILINTNIPTNSYDQIHFDTPDVTGTLHQTRHLTEQQ
jgi:hypothetical protein